MSDTEKNRIADNVSDIPFSPIRKFFDIVSEMKEAISLGIGEPDFITPWHIRSAAIQSIKDGETSYSSNAGTIELRREISRYIQDRFKLNYAPEHEILVTVGASEAIDLSLRALINPGDEVIIPDPSYVSYMPNVRLVHGVPVALPTFAEHNFRITPEQLKKAITPKTKALILPYPNNPTGAVMLKENLEAIAPIIKEADIMVISDEIYHGLVYEGRAHSILEYTDQAFVLNGFSKRFAMTGLRLGYLIAPKSCMRSLQKLQQNLFICASSVAQQAGIAALWQADSDVERMKQIYDERRRYMITRLREMGFEIKVEPQGAFYIFANARKFTTDSYRFAFDVLEHAHVGITPGVDFGTGGEGYVRFSYANSLENIKEGLDRINRYLSRLGF